MQSDFVWMDGELVETSKASVPFLTVGLHYGLALFEGIRAYDTSHGAAVFRLQDHLKRMLGSAHIAGFRDFPYTVDQLADAVCLTIRANKFGGCYIRPLVYLADGGWNLTIDTGKPRVGIAVWRQSVYLGHLTPDQGIRASVSSFTRHHPNSMMTKAKLSGNYVNSILAKTDSQRQGFDEAILLDTDGYVAECTGANLFLVRDGVLITPTSEAILEGITRSTITLLAKDAGIEVREARVSRDQLYVADEVLVCGTAAEVAGVTEVDGRRIGTGKIGPITQQLKSLYGEAVRGEHPRSAGWLTYVSKG